MLYVIVPISQVYSMIPDEKLNELLFLFPFILGLLYDCYGRFDNLSIGGKRKIKIIGCVEFLVLGLTVFLSVAVYKGKPVPEYTYLGYLLLIVPFTICLWDVIKRFIEE